MTTKFRKPTGREDRCGARSRHNLIRQIVPLMTKNIRILIRPHPPVVSISMGSSVACRHNIAAMRDMAAFVQRWFDGRTKVPTKREKGCAGSPRLYPQTRFSLIRSQPCLPNIPL
jgi:hypothetical protein